jgi:hypothetical protein
MSAPAASLKRKTVDSTPAGDHASKKPKPAPVEDLISGDRKRRSNASKKKNPKRVAKHILEAAARKQSQAAAKASNEEGKDGGEVAPAAAAAPKSKPAPKKPVVATPAAPAATVVESKVLALEYLRQWSSARASWKFQKVRQVWLLEHVYDKDQLPKKEFALMTEYIKELKGAARTVSRRRGTHGMLPLAFFTPSYRARDENEIRRLTTLFK